MGFAIANAISIAVNYIAGISKAAILAMSGLVAWVLDEDEGLGTTYAGDTVGDQRRTIQAGRCYLFDGTDDYIDCGNIGSVTSVSFYIKSVVDDQEIMTLDGANSSRVYVTGSVLSFGGSLTVSNITVDGVTKTASEAGTLINDNLWHLVTFDVSSFTASSLYLGRNASSYGNINLRDVKFNDGNLAHYKCEESAGTTAYDSSGNANHGTITNATLSTFHATDAGINYSYGNEVGYSPMIVTQGAPNGAVVFSPSLPWTSLCLRFSSPQNAITASTGVFMRLSVGSLGIHTDGRLYMGFSYDENLGTAYSTGAGAFDSIVFIKNSTSGKLDVYKNGTFVGSSSAAHTTQNLAELNNGWSSSALGIYRDVATYSSELSAGDITAYANGTVPTANLVYYGSGSGLTIATAYADKVGSVTASKNGSTSLSTFLAPRDESSVLKDVYNSVLEHTERVKYDFNLAKSNCLTFDGVDDYVACGDIGNVTSVSFYLQSIVDNQEIMTLDGANSGRIYVAGGVLTFGGSLSASAITVDGSSKTASEAGALINDNNWHLVTATVSSFSASSLQLGRDAANYGNIRLANVKFNDGALAYYPLAEGAGAKVFDVSGNAKHGTMTNFTLSNAWGTKQDVYHYNIKNGFEHYDDDATGLDILRVPYKSDGTQITPTISGYTKNSNNPSGNYHNDSESVLQAPNCPAMQIANDNEGNNFLFDASDVVKDITYALIDDNINSSGYFFADISETNQKKNLLIFDEEKTGSDLTDIQTYLNH